MGPIVPAEPAAASTESDAADLDDTELAAAYRAHGGPVFAFAARMCGATVAEDITQKVFLYLWQHPERFDRSRGSLRVFLVTVAHNKSVDWVRSIEARRGGERRVAEYAEQPMDTEERIVLLPAGERTRVALDLLPDCEREAIVTAFFGGLTYGEAAGVLDTPIGTIKSRIRCGLRRLALILEAADDPRLVAGPP